MNACIFPFSQDDSFKEYGYSFLRASPLNELGVPNFDFILIDENDPLSIMFGESKSQINDPDKILKEFDIRIKVINERKDYIGKNYVSNISFDEEFVLGTYFTEASKMAKSIMRKNRDFKVWSLGQLPNHDSPIMKLEIPYDDSNSKKSTKMKHNKKEFNKKISNSIKTSYSFKSMYLESHPFAKLSIIIMIEKDGNYFTFDDILDFVRREFDYINDSSIIFRETNRILELAEKIGFIEPVKDNNGNNKFKIISKYQDIEYQERDLKNKWINFSIEMDKKQEFDEIILNIQNKYRELRNELKVMTDYPHD